MLDKSLKIMDVMFNVLLVAEKVYRVHDGAQHLPVVDAPLQYGYLTTSPRPTAGLFGEVPECLEARIELDELLDE